MRAIKLAIIVVLGLAMMLVIAANRTPVDLHLIPQAVGVDGFSYTGVPLALVIFAAFMVGFVLALLWDYIKAGAERRKLNQKSQEIARLRKENARLTAKVGDEDADLELLAS